MALTYEEIQKAVREPKKRDLIRKAIQHQNRIKFHVQTTITPKVSQPLTDFLGWVEKIIPHDKFITFKSLFRYPLKTNTITDTCFNRLSRIFDGRNPSFNYQFESNEQRDDWEYYRQEVLKEPEVWQTKGFDWFMTEINSMLIVDLPAEQPATDKYPSPYFYFLPIEDVITYDWNPETGVIEWVIFKQPNNVICVFDNEFRRLFRLDKKNDIVEIISETPHDIGYCPARFFWNKPLNILEPDIKESPLTKQLEALDWFQFFHISKKHLDLFGAYPIYSGYEQACDFSNAENGDKCDGGFLKDKKDNYVLDSAGLLAKCPRCGNKRIAGAGTYIEVPIPQVSNIPGEDVPDLRNPIQMLTVDVSSLDYNVKEETRLKNEIITAVVGTDDDVVNDQAINELQVDAIFESQTTILSRVKKGFEAAQQWVDETIARERYGTTFLSARVNYGTEFYTISSDDLRKRFKTAKDSGASESELDAMYYQIIETQYRNNPTMLQRMIILSDLEPYPYLSREEITNPAYSNLLNEDYLRIKLNFSNFIRRFERENINILEFGTWMPYDQKIKFITAKLLDYANENKSRGTGEP